MGKSVNELRVLLKIISNNEHRVEKYAEMLESEKHE